MSSKNVETWYHVEGGGRMVTSVIVADNNKFVFLERMVAKQQFPQGAAAQFVHVQAVALQRTARRDAAGKHPCLAMPAQIHFAHPAFTAFGQVQRGTFIGAQGLPAFEQRRDAEAVIRQAAQASGQRSFVEQPIEGKRVGEGRQQALREPERGRTGGF